MSVPKDFEQRFAGMVERQVANQLPSLMPHRVGFELIEADEGRTKALGVSVFKIRDLYVFNPSIFLKGELKGTILLYVVGKNVFLPAVDNWITVLQEQGGEAFGLGKPRSKKTRSEDGAYPESVQLSMTEFGGEGKSASIRSIATEAEIETFHQGIPEFRDALSKVVESWPFSLDKLASVLSDDGMRLFANTVVRSPEFANALFRFYTPDDIGALSNMMKTASRSRLPASRRRPVVDIVDDMHSKEATELTQDERRILFRDGLFVKDAREEHSMLFSTKVECGSMTSATDTGIYDLLMHDGSFAKCALFRMPNDNYSTADLGHRRIRMLVMPLDDFGKYFEFEGPDDKAPVSRKTAEFSLRESMPDMTEAGVPATKRSIADRLFGQGAENFCVRAALVKSPTNVVVISPAGEDMVVVNGCGEPRKLVFGDAGGNLAVHGDSLIVPEGTRLFARMDREDEAKYRLGTVGDMLGTIFKEASLLPITVKTLHGGNLSIRSPHRSATMPSLDKTAAVRHLVEIEGLSGAQAQSVVKDVLRQGRSRNFFVKYAVDYAPPGSDAVGMPAKEEDDPVEYLRKYMPEPIMAQQGIDEATLAAQSGNRRLLDMSVWKGLLSETSVGGLRSEYLADVFRGMDAVGRLLFSFYWANESWEDKYGKDDMESLEESLVEVFKTTGDLALFLKSKTSDPLGGAEDVRGTLSEDIGG